MEKFIGQRARILQRGGWRFFGEILAQDDLFLTIFDEKTQRKVMIAVSSIDRIEVLS